MRRGTVCGALLFALFLVLLPQSTVSAACAPGSNPVVCENALPGNPPSEWDLSGASDPNIQGFATDISVNLGDTARFKIKTDATAYRLDIYRIGFYAGMGARRVATVRPTIALPQSQPPCFTDTATGLVDCGNWTQSATWVVPSTGVSGVYIAKLVREDGVAGASHIIFIVRDDARVSDVLFQTSDTTWQAYNSYGGNSLYTGAPAGRAYKVSYNRPFNTRDVVNRSWFFYAEYPMIRWLEANGYDLTYFTGVDSDRRGLAIRSHKVFLSVGHDEYWSAAQRANVEAARDAGIDLAFISGNTMFWKTRWEASIDGSNTPYRTLVCYKETHANAKIDPLPNVWTGTWRDPRFSPPADGGRPENAVVGNIFMVNGPGATFVIEVPASFAPLRFWRNTRIASLTPGQTAVLASNTLGYEWNVDLDNGFRPEGVVPLSSTTKSVNTFLLDYGSTYGAGTATHSLTLYRAASGAFVFGAGTIQWSWGLDGTHDGGASTPDVAMQQAMVNLFADMGAQPGSLTSGLVIATASSDTTAPTSRITSPASGAVVEFGVPLTISGTATDTGGGAVGAVEVSVDGATWHLASGTSTWTYTWTPNVIGTVTLRSSATDDSGNVEQPSPGVTVTVNRTCPCTIWNSTATPAVASNNDPNGIEVGVRFRSDSAGYIKGIRFYKGSSNTGPHTGKLWTSTGTLLASATFTGETASGWQQVQFATPVAITANTNYVASYYTASGFYSVTYPYFTSQFYSPPLRAVANGDGGGNGVYQYGTGGFPTSTFNSANYWVDVVFDTNAGSGSGPTLSSLSPSSAVAGGPAFTLTVTGSNFASGAAVRWDGSSRTTTFVSSSQLTAAITAADIAVAGTVQVSVVNPGGSVSNALPFTITSTSCPCSIWTSAATPAIASNNDPNGIEVGVRFRSTSAGYIKGIRFYKGSSNVGPHTGKVWTATGTLLASATFSGETASGWQQVQFATPVAIAANTVYVASYYTASGFYSVTYPYFTSGVNSPPLYALANGEAGGNGLYLYGAGGFPTSTFNSANYWVDVVFDFNAGSGSGPALNSLSPGSAPAGGPAFTLTVTGTNFASGATVRWNGSSRTTTFVSSTQLTAAIGAADIAAAGTAQVTVANPGGSVSNALPLPITACPCTIWSSTTTPAVVSNNDPQAIEIGVRLRSDRAGYIKGIRFYKGSSNTGPHTGKLWSAAGTLLGSATFSGETASGWQEVRFATPVAITANTNYVASYYTASGFYSVTQAYFASAVHTPPLSALANGDGGGDGLYRYGVGGGFPTSTFNSSNYWVDVVFDDSP
jgi:N,N-dimethylformamidase beta subunit-like, C-terminal/Domain of unknown function (DUF4082)/Bacterial Ig domain